jgi:hypothetical protein
MDSSNYASPTIDGTIPQQVAYSSPVTHDINSQLDHGTTILGVPDAEPKKKDALLVVFFINILFGGTILVR